MEGKSLADRKKQFLEDCAACGGGGDIGGGPTMSVGDDGYQGSAPAGGPMAGYDPVMGRKKRKRSVVDTAKRLRRK